MEPITGAIYLDQERTQNLKGGRLIEPANQMIMLTSLSTGLSTCMSTLIAWGGSTCDHDTSFDSTATAD